MSRYCSGLMAIIYRYYQDQKNKQQKKALLRAFIYDSFNLYSKMFFY